jgi:hypothetical protein
MACAGTMMKQVNCAAQGQMSQEGCEKLLLVRTVRLSPPRLTACYRGMCREVGLNEGRARSPCAAVNLHNAGTVSLGSDLF